MLPLHWCNCFRSAFGPRRSLSRFPRRSPLTLSLALRATLAAPEAINGCIRPLNAGDVPRPRLLEPNRSAPPTNGACTGKPPEGPRGAPVAAAARRARDSAKTPPRDEHGPDAASGPFDAAATAAAGAPAYDRREGDKAPDYAQDVRAAAPRRPRRDGRRRQTY